MKTPRIVIYALAAAMALAAGKALATTTPKAQTTLFRLSVSGTLDIEKTNYNKTVQVKSGTNTTTEIEFFGVMESKSFGNSTIYLLISNAVAQGHVTGLPATNLPANGYIGFNRTGTAAIPGSSYGNFVGTFYVTNKAGFYYPLQGTDRNGSFYSYIELDDNDYDFSHNFRDTVYNGSYNNTTGTGTFTVRQPMLLYISDNPYAYNDADSPGNFYNFNNSAIEIRATMRDSWTDQDGVTTQNSYTSVGGASGQAQIKGIYGVVTSATVTLNPN